MHPENTHTLSDGNGPSKNALLQAFKESRVPATPETIQKWEEFFKKMEEFREQRENWFLPNWRSHFLAS